MTDQEISQLALKIANDSKTWITLIGVFGAIVGSILTIFGNFALEWFKGRGQKKLLDSRQKILKEMLEDKAFEWRTINTLSSVIGCDEETTKHYLISIGARGSEKNDGKWGLISRHPLKNIQRQKT
ncbi:hypothetical protein [Pseudoalteromonas sp. L21]|uniref:hypothetical protein n=1 Tax=Pseudoalteromonas sp. L21 TaxID=1539746 RepID=UPI001F3DE57A|nr:hypothetical protein [Pseudoalteromonas sp. L21]MCF7516666.1 hypothetical protein [Pseudoalteromonas sp. L21]